MHVTRTTKRWLCWGTALGITVAYVISLTIHWAGAWPTYPAGVVGLVIIAVFTLVLAGERLGEEKPILVAIRNDRPGQSIPLQQFDSGPLSDSDGGTVVPMANPKVYQLGIAEGMRRALGKQRQQGTE